MHYFVGTRLRRPCSPLPPYPLAGLVLCPIVRLFHFFSTPRRIALGPSFFPTETGGQLSSSDFGALTQALVRDDSQDFISSMEITFPRWSGLTFFYGKLVERGFPIQRNSDRRLYPVSLLLFRSYCANCLLRRPARTPSRPQRRSLSPASRMWRDRLWFFFFVFFSFGCFFFFFLFCFCFLSRFFFPPA